MKRFAVSYIDWYNYNLVTLIVEAEDWQRALQQHPKITECAFDYSSNLEEIKHEAFNCDCMVECVEIT